MMFTNYNYGINPTTGYSSLSNVGEWTNHIENKKDPILSASFKVAKDAPEGDHKLFINLTYKSLKNDKWYTDKQTINIDVDHWYEDERLKYLIVVPIISVLVTIWNGIIIPSYGFLNGLGVPILIEFAKISLIAIVVTIVFNFLFEHYN